MFQGATKRTIAMTRTNPTKYTKAQAGNIGLLVRPNHLNVGPAVPRCGINLMPSSLITPSRIVYISSNDEMRTFLPCKEEDKAEIGSAVDACADTVRQTSFKVDRKSQFMRWSCLQGSQTRFQPENVADAVVKNDYTMLEALSSGGAISRGRRETQSRSCKQKHELLCLHYLYDCRCGCLPGRPAARILPLHFYVQTCSFPFGLPETPDCRCQIAGAPTDALVSIIIISWRPPRQTNIMPSSKLHRERGNLRKRTEKGKRREKTKKT